MSHKYTWLFSILGVAMCSGLASAQRTATVRFEIPGYKTPENDHGRKWYLYIDSPTGIVGLSNGLTPGALCEITPTQESGSTTGIYEFTFTSTGTTTKGATLHIAYGFKPPNSGADCTPVTNPLIGNLDEMWYVLSEFIFNPHESGHPDETPTASNLGDISYVADFSHPMKVDVYGSSDGISWGDPVARRAPDQMVKQILINELFNSDGFRSPVGHGIDTTGHDSIPPVWVNSFDHTVSPPLGITANTRLWQPPSPSDSGWAPQGHDKSEAGFIRINQPNKVFTSVVSGDLLLPGYHDAMHRLHLKYSVGSEHAILIAGSASASCNAQNSYSDGGSPPSTGLCDDLHVDCLTPGQQPTFGKSNADKYRVWAQVGKKPDPTDPTANPAYWFEVTTTNPVDTNEIGYIRDPVLGVPNHWVSSEILYIPAVADPSSSATVTTINNHLYGRLVSGSVEPQGQGLLQMVWEGTVNPEFVLVNVFEAGGNLQASAAAMLRDICVTLSTGQLGSEIPLSPGGDAIKIGYMFQNDVMNPVDIAEQGAGYFWVGGTPNRLGKPLSREHSSHYVTCGTTWGGTGNSWGVAAGCSCIRAMLNYTVPDAHILAYGWNEHGVFSGNGNTGDLSTGQMSYLNNWFDQLMPLHHSHFSPWNETYRMMFNQLGSQVYTNDYTDYYSYYEELDPQFECDSSEYMKYVFTLGTMQFADLASETPHEGDGLVGILDLLYLLQHWGNHGKADLNSDQKVNTADMILLLNNWTGPSYATSACCIDGVCSYRSHQDCESHGGTYMWTDCDPSPSDPNPCSN